MSELVKLIGAMAERGWAYTNAVLGSIDFIDEDGDIMSFRSWDEVAKFVEGGR